MSATITLIQSRATIGDDDVSVEDFGKDTTVVITGIIKIDGAAQDISGDTVTLTLKKNRDDADAAAAIQQNAVVSAGDGLATWTLLPATTNVTPRRYYYEILWVTAAGAEYQLETGSVKVLTRITD